MTRDNGSSDSASRQLDDIEKRLGAHSRTIKLVLAVLVVVLLSLFGFAIERSIKSDLVACEQQVAGNDSAGDVIDELVVRRLYVVDGAGVNRIVIGAANPSPLFFGRRFRREIADDPGIIFHNAEGTEQGGILAVGDGGLLLGMDSLTGEIGGLHVAPDGRSARLVFGNIDGSASMQIGYVADSPVLTLQEDGERVLDVRDGTTYVKRLQTDEE